MRIPTIILTLLTFSSSTFADTSTSPGNITIENFTYAGSGCPTDSVGKYISPDGLALTLIFDQYSVDSALGTNGIDKKHCNVQLDLKAPKGWSFAILDVIIAGFANLDDKVRGSQTVNFSYSGWKFFEAGKLNLVGPYDDNYLHQTQVPVNKGHWSSCKDNGKTKLNIQTELSVNASLEKNNLHCASNSKTEGTKLWVNKNCRADSVVPSDAQGFMTVDTLDGELTHQYSIAWRRCSGK